MEAVCVCENVGDWDERRLCVYTYIYICVCVHFLFLKCITVNEKAFYLNCTAPKGGVANYEEVYTGLPSSHGCQTVAAAVFLATLCRVLGSLFSPGSFRFRWFSHTRPGAGSQLLGPAYQDWMSGQNTFRIWSYGAAVTSAWNDFENWTEL